MYYINFDNNGNQAEMKWFDGITPDEDGWYQASTDIVGKRFKLVDNEVLEMTEEEKQAESDSGLYNAFMDAFRLKRNQLLLESDWTANPQIPMSEEKKAQWAAYRQSLRDMSADITLDFIKDGGEVNWPPIPS